MRYLSARSQLVELAMSGEHHEVKVDDPVALRRLIAWVDANCPFLGEEEVRALADPEFAGIEQLPVRPRLKTAGDLRRRSLGERGSPPLAAIRVERELAHGQDGSAGVEE